MSILDLLLGQPQNSMVQNNTPGINPAAPNPFESLSGGRKGGILNNRLLLNLMAGSGFSTMPDSPIGAFGRAALATQQQESQSGIADLNRQLIESQIGLNRSRANSPQTLPDPLTPIGKINRDFELGMISEDVRNSRIDAVLSEGRDKRFGQTQNLRQEFNKETSGIRASLQSLTSAQALLKGGGNPISELAAFISTIKSIDNSTVREGELANFNKAVGLANQLENLVSRAKGEGFSETVASDISDTVSRLRDPLESVLKGSKEFYRTEAKKFELDPSSIVSEVTPENIDVGTLSSAGVPQGNALQTELEQEIAALEAEIEELERGN